MGQLRFVIYDKDHIEEEDDLPIAEAFERAKQPHKVGWITLYEPTDDDYTFLEHTVGIHPLALEDSRNQRQRPKVEEYPDNTYVVSRSLLRDGEGEVQSFQSNLFFSTTQNWVIVIHERPVGLFQEVRERIRRGRVRMRSSGSDYLVYALIDAAVDTYFPILQSIGDDIEDLEDEMFSGKPDPEHLDRIHHLKVDLRRARRTVWPARDALAMLSRDETRGFKKTTMPFLRDIHDHIVQAIDLTENHREATSSLMDLYLNMVSHRMNEIIKVLTIVATLFIPLTFLAGVYGMNFDPDLPGNMPELETPYAYVAFWAISLIILGGELAFFKKRGWL